VDVVLRAQSNRGVGASFRRRSKANLAVLLPAFRKWGSSYWFFGIKPTATFDQLGLIIPHRRAHKRRFVLEPLSHLQSNLVLPGQTKTVRELLMAMD